MSEDRTAEVQAILPKGGWVRVVREAGTVFVQVHHRRDAVTTIAYGCGFTVEAARELASMILRAAGASGCDG